MNDDALTISKLEKYHAISGAILSGALFTLAPMMSSVAPQSFLAGFLFTLIGLRCYRILTEAILNLQARAPLALVAALAGKVVLFILLVTYLMTAPGVESLWVIAGVLYVVPVAFVLAMPEHFHPGKDGDVS